MEGPQAVPAVFIVLIVFLVIAAVLLGMLLTVLPFWKICTKAGFPGPLALLMLVPFANVILPFYIAFADWPVLRQCRPDPGQPR